MKRTLKVIIVGDSCVGKTSLRSRYLQSSFQRAYISTIGTDFVSRTIEVNVPLPRVSSGKRKEDDADRTKKKGGDGDKKTASLQNGSKSAAPDTAADASGTNGASDISQQVHFDQETVRITLSIWDTAGQERFKSLGSAFYRGSDAVIIAFDLSAKGSLARTANWFQDFCRLGDVAYEEEGMTVKQLKRAREQREQFCWVGVGCKGDLLEGLSSEENIDGEDDDSKKWRGTSWPEARGWFDTMIPRYLPPGEVEKEGYKGFVQPSSTSGHDDTMPYSIGEGVPANPEDVLSRPNRTSSISIPGKQYPGESSLQPGRPSDAGVAPGLAPSPGSALLSSKRQPRQSHDGSSKKKGHRKSLRSIEVWQSNQPFESSSNATNSSTASTSTPTEYQRNRWDSTTSAGGASVYYSIRGSSTMLGQSPSGDGVLTDAGSSDVSSVRTKLASGRPSSQGRGQSLSSQDRSRKQSNDQDNTKLIDEIAGPTSTRSQRTHSSSNTIKDTKEENGKVDRSTHKVDEGSPVQQSDVSVSTVPSGDPIPFPTSDELEEGYDTNGGMEIPVRRYSRKMRSSVIIHDDPEPGNDSETADLIAEQARQHRLESEQEEAADKRATLYSARPSSISSTIKPADEESSSVGRAAAEADQSDDKEQDLALAYQDQMVEQGFRLFFTSAKEGHGIDDVFEHIARRVAIRWKLEEWQEQRAQEMRDGGYDSAGVRTAPPTDEEWERERIKRAIKISSGKGTGSCCS